MRAQVIRRIRTEPRVPDPEPQSRPRRAPGPKPRNLRAEVEQAFRDAGARVWPQEGRP